MSPPPGNHLLNVYSTCHSHHFPSSYCIVLEYPEALTPKSFPLLPLLSCHLQNYGLEVSIVSVNTSSIFLSSLSTLNRMGLTTYNHFQSLPQEQRNHNTLLWRGRGWSGVVGVVKVTWNGVRKWKSKGEWGSWLPNSTDLHLDIVSLFVLYVNIPIQKT